MVADWVRQQTGVDPAVSLRGAYSTATGALRLIRGYGGFLPMWRQHMAAAGFVETDTPAVGDVGVVSHPGQDIAAIRVPGAWAAKAERGVLIEDMPMLCAWSLARG
jgi:hypothetical protein